MELIHAKYISMLMLLTSNLTIILIAMYLQRIIFERNKTILEISQRIISCLTSGILFGVLLMLILPHSLSIINHHSNNLGYFYIGLGFFLICLIEELIHLYEKRNSNEQLIESKQTNHLLRLITLIIALSVHYFFNGVLIGGQTILNSTFWIFVLAICFHMSLVAFTITLRLLTEDKNNLRVLSSMFIWIIMGPLGIFVSSIISNNNSFNSILQCLSAGTFIYITLIDMLHQDLTERKLYPLLNIILIFIGFILVVLTSSWHKHSD